MMIVDAQLHIWAASTPQRPWPARHKPHREVPLGKEELPREMDTAGVSRVVLVWSSRPGRAACLRSQLTAILTAGSIPICAQ